MTTPFRRFLPLLAGYWGLRVFLLITDFDQYAFPAYEMAPVGIIGALVESGWRGVPLYHFFDNCGGHLLWGLLVAPLFKVFGSSYMALKILPLLLGGLDLWLIWDLARRGFGQFAATVASLAFIFAPPTLLVYSMLAKGNHFEGLTLQLLATWFWLRGAEGGHHRFRFWSIAAFCAGFSIFAYSGSAIWVSLLLVAHLATRGLPSLRQTLVGAASFFLGLTPLLLLNQQTGRLQSFVGHNLSSHSYINRLVDLGHNVLLAAPGFRLASEGADLWLGALWWGAYIVAWVALVRGALWALRERERKGMGRNQLGLLIPLLTYLPAFALAYCFSDFRFRAHEGEMPVGQYRYLVPHLAFACLLFGACAGWLRSRPGKLLGLRAILLVPIALGVMSALLMVNLGSSALGAGWHYPAFDKADIARFLLRDGDFEPATYEFAWDFERLRAELDEYEPLEQQRIAFGLGRDMLKGQSLNSEQVVFDMEIILKELPEELRPAAARGVGAELSQGKRYRPAFKKHLLDVLKSHPEHAGYLAMGLSSFTRGGLSRDTLVDFSRASRPQPSIPYKLRAAWREGQGEFCGTLLARGFDGETRLVKKFLPSIPTLNHDDFWRGVESAWIAAGSDAHEFAELRKQLESDAASLASTPTR